MVLIVWLHVSLALSFSPSLLCSLSLLHWVWSVCLCVATLYIWVSLSLPNCVYSFFYVAAVPFCMCACWRCSYVRPTRHYTVFLCEDSSGDELSQDDDSIAAFPEHFLLSAPFEWSLFKCFLLMSSSLLVNNLLFFLFIFLPPRRIWTH